jgi:hypothetical protein
MTTLPWLNFRAPRGFLAAGEPKKQTRMTSLNTLPLSELVPGGRSRWGAGLYIWSTACMAVILVVRTALSDFDLYWTRVICVAPHMIIHEYEAHASSPPCILPSWVRRIVGQNEAFYAVFWIDGSHRLQGGDDEFFGPPFVHLSDHEEGWKTKLS